MALDTKEHRENTGEKDDVAERLEAAKNLAIRERLRSQCRSRLMECANSANTAFNTQDVDAVMEAFSEDGLRKGTEDERVKMKWALGTDGEEGWEKVVNKYLEKATTYGKKVISLLSDARKENAISLENMKEWMERMKSGQWSETSVFIEKTLPQYVAAWKQVAAERRDLLRDPRMKQLEESQLISPRELEEFLSGKDFLNAHYNRRVHLVGLVRAALRGLKAGPDVEKLLVEARTQLEGAVKRGVLSRDKVGVWMKRISAHKDNPKTIEDFLNGKGTIPLSMLMENWSHVRGRFDKIEERREKEGTPPQFNFVKLDVFLDWNFEKRETYVEQAEQRFESYKNDPDAFLKIRHALDAKDWAEAGDLLGDAEHMRSSLTPEQRNTLASLRRYYDAHLPKEARGATEAAREGSDVAQTLAAMREALNQIPFSSVRARWSLMLRTKSSKAVWALKVLYYNWKWCRMHGYSSDEQDAELRKNSKERTYAAVEQLQETGEKDRGHVDYDLTTDTSIKVVREDADTRSAQAWHVDETTDNTQLMEVVDRIKDTRAVWYWTRIMEKNIPYGSMEHLIDNVFPVLTRGARKLEEAGVRFTESGPPTYISASAKKEPQKHSAETPHALAA